MRWLDLLCQAWCALRGHDPLLQLEADRMFLKCASCDFESAGWELNEPRPTVRYTKILRFRRRLAS